MPQIVKTATEARAAVTGQNMRYVLSFSLLAAIGLFGFVMLYFMA